MILRNLESLPNRSLQYAWKPYPRLMLEDHLTLYASHKYGFFNANKKQVSSIYNFNISVLRNQFLIYFVAKHSIHLWFSSWLLHIHSWPCHLKREFEDLKPLGKKRHPYNKGLQSTRTGTQHKAKLGEFILLEVEVNFRHKINRQIDQRLLWHVHPCK